MISYVDVLTIMLILFVAIAAQALQSAQKKPDPGGPPVAAPIAVPLIPAPNVALAAIKQELEQNHLEVQLDPRGVVVSLPQTLLFLPGEDRVNADALATVSAIANVLSKIPNSVSLEGHADAVPIHNRRFNSNWQLAAARGLRLLELLKRYGIAESRFSIESYGAYDPKSSNDTPDGRASNRRVEIVIRDTVHRGTL